jgi:enoyl-CoA hydratase/carnithine racemase
MSQNASRSTQPSGDTARPTLDDALTVPALDTLLTRAAKAPRLASHPGAPRMLREGRYACLLLDRPDEHNRLDPADVLALIECFEDLAQSHAESSWPRALVISGAGDRSFCSGFTLQAIIESLQGGFEHMLDTLEKLPFTTIAALNGSTYGGATDLALACDLRIGVSDMRLFMPAARIGLHYYPGGLRRYVTRLGLAAASRLMLTGATVEADELLRIGFVSELCERGALGKALAALLEAVAQTDPGVVATMKRDLLALASSGMTPRLHEQMREAYEASLRSPELARRLDDLRRKR